jgi:hypothetical protein
MTRLALILALAAALGLAACGSSGDRTGSATDSSSQDASEYIVPSHDTISNDDSPSAAVTPAGEEDDEVSPTGAGEENPCDLVPKNQATTILGEGVQTSVGSQGPTCIYAPKGSGPEVTVALEQTSFQSLRNHASRATKMAVGSTSGLCLNYGATSVAVQISEGRVLRVTGPCSLAARFAGRALGRVPAAE